MCVIFDFGFSQKKSADLDIPEHLSKVICYVITSALKPIHTALQLQCNVIKTEPMMVNVPMHKCLSTKWSSQLNDEN